MKVVAMAVLAMAVFLGTAVAETERVAVASAQLEQVRVHYQEDRLADMVTAAQAGIDSLGDAESDGETEAKLRGSLWYWSAVAQEMIGDLDAALVRYQQALAIHEQASNTREVAATLNSLSNLHGMRGEQAPRLEALVRARDIFDALDERKGSAAVANSLGNYYGEMQQFETALPYFAQSVALRREMGDPAYLADGLQGLGVNLREMERLSESRTIFEEALAINRELDDHGGLAEILTNLGSIARADRRFDEALAAYQEALGYDQAAGYKYGESILTHNLALTYQQMGDPAQAEQWVQRAVLAAEELGNPERLEHAFTVRARIHEDRGNLAAAVADLRAVMDIRERRAQAARDDALLSLQTRFETAEKQREIERLQRVGVEQELRVTRESAARETAEKERELERQRSRTTLMLAMAAGLIATVLAWLFRVARRSERRLAQQRAEIEHAVAGLRVAHAELKKLYASKSAFLSFAVHDLRSPLYAIDAVCAEIEGGFIDSPLEGVGEIRGAAQRMRQELDAWLAAERREQTEVTVHPVSTNLGQLVTDVVALGQPAARAKSISLTHESTDPVIASVDPWRWREVVDNLVSNALKYSPAGSRVTVTSAVVHGRAVVRVQDQGPGISADDRDRLFTAFGTLSAQPTGGESSTGLGLHLVKRIVDAHGGAVTVDNAPEGGAIFEVSVPVKA